ncbi:MAG: glycoside hydrolase family 95 protein, partial [Duncaniella sp.]|nr:glycoside hydrolase family 95 protein [Duncaniella sp.]
MKNGLTLALASAALAVTQFALADSTPAPRNILHYNRPAAYWEEALPLGNGRLGAMVSGSVAVDTLQLNEDTFWGQSPNSNHNPDALAVLPEVRRLIFEGKYTEAQELAIPAIQSRGSHGAQYQAAGCVLIGFPEHRYDSAERGASASAKDATSYRRDLDMNTAVATTSYDIDGVTYRRRVITSFTDNVTLVRLEASEPGRLDFNVRFAAPAKTGMSILGTDTLVAPDLIKATLVPATPATETVDNLLRCVTYIKVLPDGGTLTSSPRGNVEAHGIVADDDETPVISLAGANSATIVISSATNFVNYRDISADAEAKALAMLDAYIDSAKDFDTALADHSARYGEQFSRVSLDLGSNPDRESLDTESRIDAFHSSPDDPGLISDYFQFGRYLLICSSQPGTQPANLQGLW